MNLLKFFLILLVFVSFYLLLKHYFDLEKYNIKYDEKNIPIIEADQIPYKIDPPPILNDDPLINSCTLNNEC
tara:strand:+ start:371 stop:586 length:216 start_codon:yes stop_codon:yes gene_type:complete